MKYKNKTVEQWHKQTAPEVLKTVRSLLALGLADIQADEGALLIYDHSKHVLVFTDIVGKSPKDLIGKRVALGDGVTGNAALLREMQIGSRLVNDQMRDVEGDGHPFSVIAVPILIADDLWGCITAVRFSEGATFSSVDGDTYLRYASVLSCIINMNRLLELSTGKLSQDDLLPEQCEEQNLVQQFKTLVSENPDKRSEIKNLLQVLERLMQ